MITGRLSQTLDAVTDLPWGKDFRWWKGRTKANPATIVSAEGRLKLRGCGVDADAIDMTVGNGRILINDNATGVRLSEDDMGDLAPGTYDLEVTVMLGGNDARRVLATLNVSAPI